MGRFSPTVRPEYYGGLFEALSGGVDKGIERYRTGRADQRTAAAHDMSMAEGAQGLELRANADSRAGEAHEQGMTIGDMNLYDAGYREDGGVSPDLKESLKPPPEAEYPAAAAPPQSEPPLDSIDVGSPINWHGRAVDPTQAEEIDQAPNDPTQMGPAGVADPSVVALPGQFDPNTQMFDPQPRFIPMGRGYLDTTQTPTARGYAHDEAQRLELMGALGDAGVPPNRTDLLSRETGLIDDELYPTEHPYYAQDFDEAMRLKGYSKGGDGTYASFGRGSEPRPMEHGDAVAHLYELYGTNSVEGDTDFRNRVLPSWIATDPDKMHQMTQEIIEGTFDPAEYEQDVGYLIPEEEEEAPGLFRRIGLSVKGWFEDDPNIPTNRIPIGPGENTNSELAESLGSDNPYEGLSPADSTEMDDAFSEFMNPDGTPLSDEQKREEVRRFRAGKMEGGNLEAEPGQGWRN